MGKRHTRLKVYLLLAAGLLLTACGLEGWQAQEECVQEGMLFYDEFAGDPNCGWALYSQSGVAVEIEEGALRISSSQPGQIWWTNPGHRWDDVIISTTARQVSGPNDNAYGLICRYQNPENFYIFLISGDGYYTIGKYQTGSTQIQYLLEEGEAYQFSEVIQQGEAENDIRASCIGNELTLTVNGLRLARVTDPTFVIGDVGAAAATFQPGTVVIEFESVRVIAP